jgi:hypothetical protein
VKLAALLALALVACVDPQGFHCVSSEQCDHSANEACFGACASPSSSCSSGWRFTLSAPLPGECVEIQPDAGADVVVLEISTDAGADVVDVLDAADVVDELAVIDSQPDQVDAGDVVIVPDVGPPDVGPIDTGPPDTGPPDTGPPDTGTTCATVTCTGPGTSPSCYMFAGSPWCCQLTSTSNCASCLASLTCEGDAPFFHCCLAP